MPNFGFNPFAPRVNVYTTGVETGDARRYHSRDVIRTTGERVEIDATLTPGEAGKYQKTQFEKKITEMVEKEKEFCNSEGKKLEFVSGEKINSSESAFFGLKTQQEYIQLKKEEQRRQELSLYNLSENDIEAIIVYERNSDTVTQSPLIKELYRRIATLKTEYENTHVTSSQSLPLHERVDQNADDFLTFQRIHNPLLVGHTNKALKEAEEGIVDSHIPRVNMTVLLDEVDREFVKQHPLIKEDLENLKRQADLQRESEKRLRISNKAFHNVNIPLSHEAKTQSSKIQKPAKFKQETTFTESNQSNSTLFIRNLPKDITCQELIGLFGKFEAADSSLPRIHYSLLTGRMRGQAFITFCDMDTAKLVCEEMNGMEYHGKLLNIQFKRK